MYELTTEIDALALQSVPEMASLGRRRHRHHRSSSTNVCLVTANYSLNGINILNVLNFFG